MIEPDLRVPDLHGYGAALDAWAAAAFADADGAAALAPFLARWREEVGELRSDDPEFEGWAVARTDWALVDMGGGAACVHRDPAWRAIADAWVGLFEVWPTDGGPAWLRDRIGGACLPLGAAIDLRRQAEGPAGLWELRGVVREGALVPCRPPLAYPLAVLGVWPDAPAVDPGRPARLLAALRGARLRHARTPRADPRPGFRAAIVRASTVGAGDSV